MELPPTAVEAHLRNHPNDFIGACETVVPEEPEVPEIPEEPIEPEVPEVPADPEEPVTEE